MSGYNGNGQFGLGYTNSIGVPQHMRNEDNTAVLYGVKKVSAGAIHTLLALEDGSALSVGYNGYGALGIGNTTEQHLPVQMVDKDGNNISNVKM